MAKKMSKDNFLQDLAIFGLTVEEAKVYLALLEKGQIGDIVGRLKEEVDINRTTLYGILERLSDKGWINDIEVRIKPKRTKYVARPPFVVFEEIIIKKKKELDILKEKQLFIGDQLDKIFQENKMLSLNTIHPISKKYLKNLSERGWKINSEVIETSTSLGRSVYDYELMSTTGNPTRECGLIIFEYNRNIENDDNLVNAALSILKSKAEHEIRSHDIPNFEDVKIENNKIGNFKVADVYLKFISNENWISAGKQGVLSIKNKIFLIHGTEENFHLLMEAILNAEKFHHLV